MLKKLMALLLSVLMVSALMLGCNKGKGDTGGDDGDVAEAEAVVSTVGNPDGTHFEMWVFVEAHANFYASMVESWNKQNPDKQVEITFTTYPYADMHNKLTLAIQSGKGAPDLSDIEIGQFPNYLVGDVPGLYPMNDAIAPYKEKVVESRLNIYSKDGMNYGVPTHVGATVMYYNVEILEQYGIDYATIKTWDDYTAAAEKLKEASNGEVYMTSVDTGGTDWLWIAMSQYGEQWVDDKGKANVELESVANMLKMQQGWLNDGLAMVSPGGQVDMEEGYANVSDGAIASFPKAMWFMSRFINYMPELSGKFAIAPLPVFEEGQNKSVGIGGTGTVVMDLEDNENPELAGEWLAWAKLSEEGNKEIWNVLGFDTVNTEIWTDSAIVNDTNNQYIKFFKTNPFDVLNAVKDSIYGVNVGAISSTINEVINLTTLNNIFENGADVDEELEAAQSEIDIEQ